ncbi:MAG: ABC transporter ATP-binding protein [Bacilli bacterium]
MSQLILRNVTKEYKNKKETVVAVKDFNLESNEKEFIVFVGPSGCGKSTTLRMIAGLEEISKGEIIMDNEIVNEVEPKFRNVAMVFQNYALYPHMTAYQNMAFGLKNMHVPKDEIDRRINDAAEILDIKELLNRKPKAMSGGQRQRVALGRAIVRTPRLFLLDEPLSNLDAKLRAQMRVEITKLYEKLDTTFIYVTHDQVEAMTMGTRIVVMRKGVVQQIDTPTNLYDYPTNRFVAGFLGTPQMNFYEVDLSMNETDINLKISNGDKEIISIDVDKKQVRKINEKYSEEDIKKSILGIRSEDISICKGKTGIPLRVNIVEILGSETLVYGDLNLDNVDKVSTSKTSMVIKTTDRVNYKNGDIIYIKLNNKKIHLFLNNDDDEPSILV